MVFLQKLQSINFERRNRISGLHPSFSGSHDHEDLLVYTDSDDSDYSDNYYSYSGKDDHITPLVDKLYHEQDERIERPYHTTSHNSHRQEYVDDAQRWSVGKISFLILVALSLADIFVHMVDAQIESLELPDHYDALSADVIRPAFRYRGDPSRSSKPRSSMGLGSAAISSVTTTLSPILPFTGGIDLRREDYWTDGVFGSLYSVVEKVRHAFEESPTTTDSVRDVLSTPRGGAAVASKPRHKHKSKTNASPKHEFVLSTPESFVPLQEIADSTLKDVTTAFRYTLESTRRDFNLSKFLSGVLPRVKTMMERMSTATTRARGPGVVAPITGEGTQTGDICAIHFCAAMRIFAEWRVLRQVPPGYKGYAVGIGLGQKDIVQNIAKIESAIHDYLDWNADASHVRTSPTLRDLLQYEVDMDVHDNTKLPRLKEKSGAMGLLWVRRQLLYQTEIFNNLLDVPNKHESSIAAVQAAYDDVYGDLHGWAVQKIFSYSFQAAPDGIEIYKYMNPHRLEEVRQEARAKILGMPVPKKRKIGGPLAKLEHTPIGKFGRHIGNEWNKLACNVSNEWDKFSDTVGNEWDKVAANLGQVFGQQRSETVAKPPRQFHDCTFTAETNVAEQEQQVEAYIRKEMRADAYEHIRAYLEVVDPLLDDLTNLIDEFNMDDPTKV